MNARANISTIRVLYDLLRLEPALVTIATLSCTVATALALVPYFAVARMANAVYDVPPRLGDVRALAMLALGAVLVRYILVSISTMVAHAAAFRILGTTRLRLAQKLGGVPLSFFAQTSTGKLKRTLMDDVNQIEGFIAHNFPDGVAAVIVPISTAIALFYVDWRMALASIAVAPLAIAAMSFSMRNIGKAHAHWQVIQDRINAAMLEYVRGIHVIKSFGLTARRFGDLARSVEEGLQWLTGFMRANGQGYGAFGTVLGSSLVILVPVGGWLHVNGSLSLTSLVLFVILGPQLVGSMIRLMFAWGNIDRIRHSCDRIRSILDTKDIDQPTSTAMPAHNDIRFHDVSFSYSGSGKAALHGVSFDAPAGKVTALVGPSGAGKTSALRLVPRLWEPTSGIITLGGVDIRSLPLEGLLSRVAMVFQDVFLFHGTVRDNVRLGRADASEEEIIAACKAACAHGLIVDLPKGYDTMLGERGTRLSGGEKQRLSIARALLKDAPVLLLDEATAFADAENEARIQEGLSTLSIDRTIIIVAHRLSTIVKADNIVVLDHGRVVDNGTHEALLARCALYRSLWDNNVEAIDWSIVTTDDVGVAAEAS